MLFCGLALWGFVVLVSALRRGTVEGGIDGFFFFGGGDAKVKLQMTESRFL